MLCVCRAVGGVFGFALAYGGADSVIWAERIDEFPYYKGMVVIMASWVTSPLVCGLLAAFFFFLLRTFVLRSKDPLRMSVIVRPLALSAIVSHTCMSRTDGCC
jgi:phosphate/sulfate permease